MNWSFGAWDIVRLLHKASKHSDLVQQQAYVFSINSENNSVHLKDEEGVHLSVCEKTVNSFNLLIRLK